MSVLAGAVLAAAADAAAPKDKPRPLLVPLDSFKGGVPAGPQKPTAPSPPTGAAEPPIPVVRIEWRANLDSAIKDAAASDRVVLIYFHADWCQPCRLMNDATFVNRAVAMYVGQNFVPVKVDDSSETSAVSKKYQVRIYPSILFLAPGGEPLHMLLFPRTAAELYPILEKVQAIPRMIEAQRKAPDDLEATFRLGEVWVTLDRVKQAEPYLKRTVELDPKNERGRLVQARLWLAIVPLEDGDAPQAIRNLRQFAEEFKDSPLVPTALHAIGAILARDGKFQEARQAFEDLRTRFPRDVMAYEADKAIDGLDARLKAEKEAPPAKPASPPEEPAPAASKK
ncbi:MAG: thioredoxin family protein [Planctomycetota bacterium]|nr:thioredoxin family protein [Planctomycetota bacterium]